MKIRLFIISLAFIGNFKSQSLYFPPLTGNTWNTTSPLSLGWCDPAIQDLYTYLEQTNTKAFILLIDGKIVLEKYFGTFTADSLWVWNSAGKTLTSMAVGIAQKQGFLSIEDSTSKYLNAGWTSAPIDKEAQIKIRHQLTMTSGLGYVGDYYCTDPSCLVYLAEPETRWSYHNAVYTLLDPVLEAATGQTLNNFVNANIRSKIGMNGLYIKIGYNNINISNARSMARYGLLLLSKGIWNGTPILDDPAFFTSMTTSSQNLNPSYGYLTWLNGKSSYMIPSPDVQISVPEKALPNAPDDVFAALGKNGQIINVSPSQNLVMIRMGNADGNSLVSNQYNDTIWQKMNLLICTSLEETSSTSLNIFPNPTENVLKIEAPEIIKQVSVFDLNAHEMNVKFDQNQLDLSLLKAGIYILKCDFQDQVIYRRFIKQ